TAAVAVVVGVWGGDLAGGIRGRSSDLDTTRYAILPFEHGPGVDTTLNETQRLHDAIARWKGVTATEVTSDSRSLTPTAAERLARSVHAGRFVRGVISKVDDSTRVSI